MFFKSAVLYGSYQPTYLSTLHLHYLLRFHNIMGENRNKREWMNYCACIILKRIRLAELFLQILAFQGQYGVRMQKWKRRLRLCCSFEYGKCDEIKMHAYLIIFVLLPILYRSWTLWCNRQRLFPFTDRVVNGSYW